MSTIGVGHRDADDNGGETHLRIVEQHVVTLCIHKGEFVYVEYVGDVNNCSIMKIEPLGENLEIARAIAQAAANVYGAKYVEQLTYLCHWCEKPLCQCEVCR
jgi:hypothetical protein